MSRKGNPYDNAFAESFMKTLKHEEVYRSEYRDRNGSSGGDRRVHRARVQPETAALPLGYRTPAEIEAVPA